MTNIPVWNRLGVDISDCTSWDQAIVKSKLNWTVSKHQLRHPINKEEKIDVWVTMRDDTKKVLKSVGSVYKIVQNHRQFSFINALLEKGCKFECAGEFLGGKRVFVLASIGKDFWIKGTDDLHKTYLLSYTAHTGEAKLTNVLAELRFICSNSLQIALKEGNDRALSVYHRSGANKRLSEAEKILSGLVLSVEDIQSKLNFLAGRKMSKEIMEEFVIKFCSQKPKAEVEGDVTAPAKSNMTQILELYEKNDNNAFPMIRGTAYNLLNAITEWHDHYKTPFNKKNQVEGIEEKARAEVALFGSSRDYKNRALSILLDVAKNAPYHPLEKTYHIPSQSNPNLN